VKKIANKLSLLFFPTKTGAHPVMTGLFIQPAGLNPPSAWGHLKSGKPKTPVLAGITKWQEINQTL